jgi:hypothetical protein
MSKTLASKAETVSYDNKQPVMSSRGAGGAAVSSQATVKQNKKPFYRRTTFMVLAAIVLLAASILGMRYWAYARSHETTDDAYLQISDDGGGSDFDLRLGCDEKVILCGNDETRMGMRG